jgi:hypothetical protein
VDYPGAGNPPTGIWRRPKDESSVLKGETPASIVKVSSGSSTVVPFNYENNFMLLGDALFVAFWPKSPANVKQGPAPIEWVRAISDAYDAAATSPVYEDWPFKSSNEARRRALALYRSDQNDGSLLYAFAQNQSGRRASCMTCHMLGAPAPPVKQ